MREREISVDINGGAFKFLKYKQYDHNNLLKIIVKEGKEDVILTGYTARAFFERPDGVILEKNCTIVSNEIKLMITNDVLARKGKVSTEITLSDGNKIVTTFRMYLEVEGSIDRNSAIEEDPEWDLIKDGLGVLDTKANQSDLISLTNRVTTNETDIENLENTKVDNTLFENLTDRVEENEEKLNNSIDVMYSSVEGNYVSTDSLNGYLKDVEILGNTIQDASNLADIRSVGDKVEGQELYEIPVLSVGKNLLKDSLIRDFTKYTFNETYKSMGLKVEKGKSYIASLKLIDSFSESDLTNTYFSVSDYCNPANPSNPNYHHLISEGIYAPQKKAVASNDGYIYFCFFNQSGNTKDVFDKLMKNIEYIQLEEGTVATSYEPYQEDKLTILSPTPLEKVGDVADRIVEKDGVWGVEKHLLDVTFTGNEEWLGETESIKDVIRFRLKNNPYDFSNINKELVICDKFTFLSSGASSNYDVEGISVAKYNDYGILVSIRKDKLTSNDSDGFNAWLKNNGGLKVIASNNTPQFIPLPHDQQIKLRTFANKTNISFGCEIEGTLVAQVPKSLGATVNTHTEQISNLNKELDRVKKLEESTVSTVTTESDFTTVEATSGGYFEDVRLEGKTLVNIVTTYDTSKFSLKNAIKQEDGYFKLQYGATVNDSNVIPRYRVHLYKPSTTYTVIVDIKENTTGTFLGVSAINSCIDSATISKRDFNNLTGISTITFKTRDDITISDKGVTPTYDLYFGIWKDGGDLSKHITFKYWVLEGDHTQNPPSFFEGLKSVGDTTDEIVVSSNNNQSEQIETTDDNGTTTTIDNPDYQADKKRLLFYNNETQTWEKPILREWDSIEKHADGKYYYHQRSAEVVLNGSEDWKQAVKGDDFARYYIETITDAKSEGDIICNVFTNKPSMNDINNNTIINTICVTRNKYLYVGSSITSTNEFKTWLQTNNVTVVYQLAQEKVYECTNIDLITYANETNYVVESGVIVPKSTLKVLQNATNIIRQLQQKVSVLETDNNRIMQILSDIRNN